MNIYTQGLIDMRATLNRIEAEKAEKRAKELKAVAAGARDAAGGEPPVAGEPVAGDEAPKRTRKRAK